MIHFQSCRGFTLFRLGRWRAELWFCPRNEVVPVHVHPNIVSRLLGVWGLQQWTVGNKTRTICGLFRRRHSTGTLTIAAMKVKPNVRHGVSILGELGVFLNVEKWVGTGGAKGAADDFVKA